MFEKIYAYLFTKGYYPEIKNDIGIQFIECSYSDRLLNDESLREWVAKDIASWHADITDDGIQYLNNTRDFTSGVFIWGCTGFDRHKNKQTTQVRYRHTEHHKITDTNVVMFHPVLAALTSMVAA